MSIDTLRWTCECRNADEADRGTQRHALLVNAAGTTGLVLPLTIGSLEGRANLGSWTVYIDGVRQDGVTLSINADGRLTLHAKGMLMTIR